MSLKESKLIFESDTSFIYKGKDKGQDVIIKLLKDPSPNADLLLKFHNEYEYTKDVKHPSIRKAIRKDKIDNKYALYLEYFDGESIGDAFIKEKRDFKEILEASVLMADAISQIHQLKIIHKDLTKDNVLINRATKTVKVIDFGLSTKVDIKKTNLGNPNVIDGNLFYVAPEQMGRMNRKTDYRADLYSLGVLFYEMFTGRLPFTGADGLEIVHKHMTEIPVRPSELNPSIPETISNIILTLMSKNAEDRYQSSIGLKNDLVACQAMYLEKQSIEPIDLSVLDYSGHFKIPEKLYGREKELEELMEAFDNIGKPAIEAIFVTGYSGVGKSALINETHIPITKQRGYFIKGKFDQFQRDVPYFAFTEAINELARYLLSEGSIMIETYKKLILDSVGELGQIIIDIAPQMELLIGTQPEIIQLDAMENANRFKRVFLNFLKSISIEDHPLVLFLDDLQWADMASIELVKQIILSDDHPNFLFIGAYRDNEVDESHQLNIMLNQAKAKDAITRDIHLSQLTKNNVKRMICETVHEDSDLIQKLTDEVYRKTQGNAFFTIQLITSILDEGHISYDIHNHKLNINIEQIQKKNYSENVVEFMASKLDKLPNDTISVMKLAASIGNQFEIEMLAKLLDNSVKVTFEKLKPAISEELIIPGDEDYQLLGMDEKILLEKLFIFNFSHDRVQQAAYSMLEPGERSKLHLHIALLLNDLENKSDYIFEIVHQFNEALELIKEPEHKLMVAELNLEAAKKARNSTAYSSALIYISVAETMLGENSWDSHYDLTLSAHGLGAEINYLNGEPEKSDHYIIECLNHAKNPIEKADIYYLKMLRLTLSNEYADAIEAGRSALEELDFDFPSENLEAHIGEQMTFLIGSFQSEGVESMADHPDMKGSKNLAIIKILDNFSMPTYVGGFTNLWILQACMKVSFSIKNGNTPETAYALSELGLILNLQSQFELGLKVGELSKTLAEKFEKVSLRHKARSFHLIANYNFVWNRHINDIAEINDEGFRASMNCGELIFAGYTNFQGFYNRFYSGSFNLEEIKQGLPDAIKFNESILMDLARHALISLEMCINSLTGESKNPLEFQAHGFTESEFIELCKSKKDFYGIATLYTYKAQALYTNGYFKEAKKSIEMAYEFVAPLMGSMVHFPTLKFFEALSNYQLYDETADNKELDSKLDETIALFENWSIAGKENLQHKLFLLKAEQSRVKKNFSDAKEYYLKSISDSKKYGFLQNEAIAHELIGRLWFNEGQDIYGNLHIERASVNYYQWGAMQKYDQLKNEFSEFLIGINVKTSSQDPQSSMYQEYYHGSFDTKTLIKASHVLAEEIRLRDLLGKSLEIISENAGADKSAIILKRDNEWYLEALSERGSKLKILGTKLSASNHEIPSKILSYCLRTKEEFIMTNNEHQNLVSRDDYIKKFQPKSIAVIPSFLKKELRALLYIENKVASDAFSKSKIQILRMLSGQIAISIENARLYDHMKQVNEAYQKFVPTKFLDSLGRKDILKVNLGDHIPRQMTAIFSDIRDYTNLSEKMSPKENFDFINRYLNTVGPIVEKHDGIVMQFIGDGILSLFSSATNAVNAAIETKKVVNGFNQDRIKENKSAIGLGFGIHTGKMILGIIGDLKRRQAGVISSEINTVSRLEGLNKLFGTSIIISEDTFSHIDNKEDYHYRFLGKVQVKGQEAIVKLYEFYDGELSDDIRVKVESQSLFEDGLTAYFQKDFLTAAGLLKKVLEINPNDRTAEKYLKSSAECIVSGVPSDWTGVERMKFK
ncbi:AAA family ATPase [Lutimonas saemankumensis]|uniref:protein kinase domain-containing protein n=1 Tax=Lutimonas saemankumensis TaxID=483016 RepID=UPI001CD3366D|nr:AAA family ATPase [Lutimonas saemankumensis]MCA0933901.1 AAA family ATPase [Lutimonas saemankumensis]